MLGMARRFAAAPIRTAFARPVFSWAAPGMAGGAMRGAAVVRSPRPLSIRNDSLFVKCMIAAVVYFVPQDIVFLSGLLYIWHSTAKAISPKKKHTDAEATLEAFKAKKGLDNVGVYK